MILARALAGLRPRERPHISNAIVTPSCTQDLIERIEAFLGAACGDEGALLACPPLGPGSGLIYR